MREIEFRHRLYSVAVMNIDGVQFSFICKSVAIIDR
jgi:hypothetical protein